VLRSVNGSGNFLRVFNPAFALYTALHDPESVREWKFVLQFGIIATCFPSIICVRYCIPHWP
jgi:hypothetical protein